MQVYSGVPAATSVRPVVGKPVHQVMPKTDLGADHATDQSDPHAYRYAAGPQHVIKLVVEAQMLSANRRAQRIDAPTALKVERVLGQIDRLTRAPETRAFVNIRI